jgi:hypothetical protein
MSVIRCKIPSNSVEWSDPNGNPEERRIEMENYIMLDGRKFEVNNSLSDLLRGVVKEKEKDSPFKRVDGTEYYFITDDGCIEVEEEENDYTDDMHHKIGNYCSDIGLLRQRNLHETLNRLLWRFSLENGGDSEWDGIECHWYITFQEGVGEKKLGVEWTSQWHHQGVVFFSSIRAAERAIDEIIKPFMTEHPEFVW